MRKDLVLCAHLGNTTLPVRQLEQHLKRYILYMYKATNRPSAVVYEKYTNRPPWGTKHLYRAIDLPALYTKLHVPKIKVAQLDTQFWAICPQIRMEKKKSQIRNPPI